VSLRTASAECNEAEPGGYCGSLSRFLLPPPHRLRFAGLCRFASFGVILDMREHDPESSCVIVAFSALDSGFGCAAPE
jgi:hypothetical protein